MDLLRDYAIYDFETTGLDTSTCDVIEIGLMVVRDGEIKERKSWLIKIDCPLPEKIIEITGITDDLLNSEGVAEEVAFKEFAELAKDLPLIGHNIMRYDNPILYRKATAHGVAELFEKGMAECVDTAGIFKAILLEREPLETEPMQSFWMRVLNEFARVKFNLVAAYEHCGFTMEGITAHRALGDVEMVHRVYNKFLTKHDEPTTNQEAEPATGSIERTESAV